MAKISKGGIREKGDRWEVFCSVDGKQKFKLAPNWVKTEEEARRFLAEWKEETFGEGTLEKTNGNTKLLALVDMVLEEHYEHLKNSETYSSYKAMLTRFIPDDSVILSKTDAKFLSTLRLLMANELKPATIKNIFYMIHTSLKFAQQWGMIETIPEFPRIKVPKNGRDKYFSLEEEDQILHEALKQSQPYHWYLCILFDTGARVSEALAIRIRDVNMDKKVLTLRHTKNGKPRSIPMTDRLVDLFEVVIIPHVKDRDARIFNWKKYQVSFLWNQQRKRLGKMHDPLWVMHCVRHTCASRLVQAGVSIYKVSKWLGHGSVTVTERYAHLAPDDLDGLAEHLNK